MSLQGEASRQNLSGRDALTCSRGFGVEGICIDAIIAPATRLVPIFPSESTTNFKLGRDSLGKSEKLWISTGLPIFQRSIRTLKHNRYFAIGKPDRQSQRGVLASASRVSRAKIGLRLGHGDADQSALQEKASPSRKKSKALDHAGCWTRLTEAFEQADQPTLH
jgi:hypothetical protein